MNCFSILVKQYARRVHWIITSCRAGEWPFLENGTRSLDKKRKSTPKSSNGERDRRSVNARFREAYLSWRLVVKLLFLPATDFLFIRLRAMFSRNVAHDLLCKVPLIRISVLTHVQASWRYPKCLYNLYYLYKHQTCVCYLDIYKWLQYHLGRYICKCSNFARFIL